MDFDRLSFVWSLEESGIGGMIEAVAEIFATPAAGAPRRATAS